ncbi:MAG: hypothetical protein H6Q67_2251 [Firmicutes bacterium]|nr:hypothetical protein [Bacillota bacterium]
MFQIESKEIKAFNRNRNWQIPPPSVLTTLETPYNNRPTKRNIFPPVLPRPDLHKNSSIQKLPVQQANPKSETKSNVFQIVAKLIAEFCPSHIQIVFHHFLLNGDHSS